MSDPEDDMTWLEEKLVDEEPYVSNAGFSQRVLQALPRQRRLSARAKRRLIKGASALVGIFVFGLVVGADTRIWQDAMDGVALITLTFTGFFLAIAAACSWVFWDKA